MCDPTLCVPFFLTCAADQESESIRTHFVTELCKRKELYAGYVSKSPQCSIMVRKGCTITVLVFLQLLVRLGLGFRV